LRRRAYALEARAPQPSWSCERRQVTSGWAPLRSIGLHSREFRPIPVRQNSCPWECKVTPAYGTCQEGNTICCISSNDAADARQGIRFPHRAGIFTGVAGSKASCASHFQPSPRTSLRCTMPRPRERGRPIRGSPALSPESHKAELSSGGAGGAHRLRRLATNARWILPHRTARVRCPGG
jgi:hypothetical protein